MTDQPIRQYPDERREMAETDMLAVEAARDRHVAEDHCECGGTLPPPDCPAHTHHRGALMAYTPTTLHLKVDADAAVAADLAPRVKAAILDGLGAALANGGNLVDWDALAEAAAAQVMAEILRVRQATPAEAAIARVRRLCELTIAVSVRVDAINQARDTLAALDGSADIAPDIRADKKGPTIANTQASAGELEDSGANTTAPEADGMEGFEYGCFNCCKPITVGRLAEHRCDELEQPARTTANNPATSSDSGPSVADCRRDDRRWFDVEKGGE